MTIHGRIQPEVEGVGARIRGALLAENGAPNLVFIMRGQLPQIAPHKSATVVISVITSYFHSTIVLHLLWFPVISTQHVKKFCDSYSTNQIARFVNYYSYGVNVIEFSI